MRQQHASASYKHINALSRGLEVLRVLNQSQDSLSNPSAISKKLGLNRTTVRRILETLKADGYVRQLEGDGEFCLTGGVRCLSDGYTNSDNLSLIASPILRKLTEDILWPCDLATARGDAMIIRKSTQKFSALSFNRVVVGEQRPMLTTAIGRAFISFCPEQQRSGLIEILYGQYRGSMSQAGFRAAVSHLAEETKQRGYAVNFGEWPQDPRIAAIAIPVYGKIDDVIGAINIISIKRAMTIEALVEKFLLPLKAAAVDIQRGVAIN